MKSFFSTLALCASITITLQSALASIPVGSTVDFDRVTSTNPAVGAWDRGVIVGTTTIAGQVNYKIRNKTGTPYTIPDDPRWIRAADPDSPAPDGTHTGPYPGSAGVAQAGSMGGMQAGAYGAAQQFSAPGTTSGGQPASVSNKTSPPAAASISVGAQVQFDRVEGSKPEYGRWDDGVVVGRDQWGRVQIRGKNGIMYNIHEDPRWILPAGTPPPGPRHDYLDHPAPAKLTPNAPISNTPLAGGSAGPLAGEWAVVGVDGRPASGYGMTFNFVGSRYELIHYSGQTEAGHFSVSGSTIRMVQEDGSEYGNFQYSIQGNRLVLKAPGTEFVCERAHK